MTKIMFVCHGNICRSPLAEFVMKDLVSQNGLSDRFLIASSATSGEETGNPVYAPVQRLMRNLAGVELATVWLAAFIHPLCAHF